MDKSGAFNPFRLFNLGYQVVGIGYRGGGSIRDLVGNQDFYDILFRLIFGMLCRSSGCPGPPGGGGAALDAGIHIGFVVIADV